MLTRAVPKVVSGLQAVTEPRPSGRENGWPFPNLLSKKPARRTCCTYNKSMGFEWDERDKAGRNYRKHGVRMPEAIPIFDDRLAITLADQESDPHEVQR